MWTDGSLKSRGGKSQEENRQEEERRSEKRKGQKKDAGAGARKGSKVAKHFVLPVICNSRKKTGAEPSGPIRDEKLRAVVARSTSRSQKAQSTPCSDHFCNLRCRQRARPSGAKPVSKSRA